jgi:hypothetical protein
MIPMARALTLWRLALGGLVVGGAVARCRADVTLPNTPAAYRLQNCAVADPQTAGCGRGPLPPYNRGCWLNNPRGTGVDDPWRPPKVWPQTRYPVVPAYTRPSFGFYETSWRVLNVCGTSPWTRTPPLPMPTVQPPPVQRPASSSAPGANPAEPVRPRAVPPKAVPPKGTPAQDQFLPRTNEAQPAPTVPRAIVPKTGQDDFSTGFPTPAAMTEPDEFNSGTAFNPNEGTHSEITVQAF